MMNPNPGIGPGMQQNPNMLQSPQMVNPQQQQQQQQPQPGLAHPVEKADSITKAKNLIGPLRDSLSSTLKAASQTLHHNNLTDVGTMWVPRVPSGFIIFLIYISFQKIYWPTSTAIRQTIGGLLLNLRSNWTAPGEKSNAFVYLKSLILEFIFLAENCPSVLRAAQVEPALFGSPGGHHPIGPDNWGKRPLISAVLGYGQVTD